MHLFYIAFLRKGLIFLSHECFLSCVLRGRIIFNLRMTWMTNIHDHTSVNDFIVCMYFMVQFDFSEVDFTGLQAI